jgi:lipopolysaccharide export LptBFGC system permease protein LptF
MNLEYLLLLTLLFSLLLMVIQRTEARYRLAVLLGILVTVGILLRNFVVYREIESEAWTALIIALVFNFLFWIMIGRYNPVGSSDSIQVLGMDD